MHPLRPLPAAIVGLIILAAGSYVRADTGTAAQAPATSPIPLKGMNMDDVRTRFGNADRALPAVGNPPITRWIYKDYVVYFEYSHVIHAVRPREEVPETAGADSPVASVTPTP